MISNELLTFLAAALQLLGASGLIRAFIRSGRAAREGIIYLAIRATAGPEQTVTPATRPSSMIFGQLKLSNADPNPIIARVEKLERIMKDQQELHKHDEQAREANIGQLRNDICLLKDQLRKPDRLAHVSATLTILGAIGAVVVAASELFQ